MAQLSPEQIAGRIKLEGYENAVSVEIIYRSIAKDKASKGALYCNLRRKEETRNKKMFRKSWKRMYPRRS
jgi:IS30 family transposase